MQQSVKERLIEFLKYKKISQRAFELSVGLSNGYVNNIRVSIQPNTIQKIVLRYPHINEGWLLTGNGPMLKSEAPGNVEVYEIPENIIKAPLIGQYAHGGHLLFICYFSSSNILFMAQCGAMLKDK